MTFRYFKQKNTANIAFVSFEGTSFCLVRMSELWDPPPPRRVMFHRLLLTFKAYPCEGEGGWPQARRTRGNSCSLNLEIYHIEA